MRKLTKIIAIAAFASSSVAHGATPDWKISESNGIVNILRSGVSKIALSGGSLQPGDVISTGKKSRAVLVRGQEYVVVSPNSRLRISEPKASGGIVQFFEEIGNVIFRIDKKATPHFGVKTPYLAAVVKGTTFSVTVTETGSSVQVTEGAVQVSTLDGGATQLLSPGMIGMVRNGDQFRLSITGSQAATIVSPNAPDGEGVSPPANTEIATGDFDGVISAPVAENPVSLSNLTSGLVNNGQSGRGAAQFARNDVSLPIDLSFSNGGGNGNGNNGNGNGNGGSNGGGNGNGNNGNGNGNGGSNGGGNGNGNNGNGNGNGGSNGTGNNGNANGNGANGNAGQIAGVTGGLNNLDGSGNGGVSLANSGPETNVAGGDGYQGRPGFGFWIKRLYDKVQESRNNGGNGGSNAGGKNGK